jgi:PRTRC genetic system protein A
MDQRDEVIQTVTPLVAVPSFAHLAHLHEVGQRYLVGRYGLMLEVRRPWFHGLWPTGTKAKGTYPYGDTKPFMKLLCGPLPMEFLQRFEREAASWSPSEHATWITWHEVTGVWTYRELKVSQRGPHCIQYERPTLEEDEHLVLDLHSHGDGHAFFSPQDDADDLGEVKIAGVLGKCRHPRNSWCFRMVALGHQLPFEALRFEENNLAAA